MKNIYAAGAGILIVLGIAVLAYSSALDIKKKRQIEERQNAFVDTCAEQQDPNILLYVERLRACRTAAELKFKMPAYLNRVQ